MSADGEPVDRRRPGAAAKAASRPGGDFERLAGRVVGRFLQKTVTLQDDGSLRAMPDLRIDHPDGNCSFGEVVSDTDREYAQTYAELVKLFGSFPGELPLPESSRMWSVAVRFAHVRSLPAALAPRLSQLEAQGQLFEYTTQLGPGDTTDPLLHELTAMGVVELTSRGIRAGENGHALIYQDGVSGRPDWPATLDWLERRLLATDWQDVRDKLRLSGGTQRHLVIGLTFATPGDVFFALTDRLEAVPDLAPTLPPEVTHLWLMPMNGMGRFLAWFPDGGWLDVTYGRV